MSISNFDCFTMAESELSIQSSEPLGWMNLLTFHFIKTSLKANENNPILMR